MQTSTIKLKNLNIFCIQCFFVFFFNTHIIALSLHSNLSDGPPLSKYFSERPITYHQIFLFFLFFFFGINLS